MKDASIANIKGIKNGILVELSQSEEWTRVTGDLAAQLDAKSTFFKDAKVTVDLGERPVPKDQMHSLKALLDRRGLEIWSVMSSSQTTIDAAHALDLKTNVSNTVPTKFGGADDATHPNRNSQSNTEIVGSSGLMVRRTLRAGQKIESDGHVVIFGDVNPSAQVIAGGDVVVWGRLRGNVHAGAHGDEDAIVCALDMQPTQLRIAHHIVTSPPIDKARNPLPEVALIRDEQIIVEIWGQ
jgi:septum site-determining protein MinC